MGNPNGPGIRWVTIRKASLRNSSVGGGDLRNSGMRVAEGCLERKLLKRGVISVMFADCGKFRGYVLPSLSVYSGSLAVA